MHEELCKQERPNRLSAEGAFLFLEAWQSGLSHRAYPSAVLACFDP
jgi:hypothetical protein